jgi:cytoplasmic FMR1 interacting protein
MQIAPFNYVKRSKHYDASKWPLSSSTLISPQADLMQHLPQIREDHVKYISELARYSNEVTTTFKESRSDAENRDTADLALRGLQLLSEWTTVVTELYSWKLLHPTDHHMNKECPVEAEEYERVGINFGFVVPQIDYLRRQLATIIPRRRSLLSSRSLL